MRRLASLTLALLALAGCKLIDQRTFGGTPTAPDPAALNQPGQPRYPLLTLPLGNPDADWRASVDDAVRAALARKPEAAFDVVAPVSTNAAPAVTDRAVANGRADTAMVAEALRADGIPEARITLGLRGDLGNPPRQVLLYAR